MAGITAAGSASGMDFESIIMASVQAKAAQLNKQTALKKEETKVILSGVGKLKNALSTFQKSIDALTKDNGFNVRKVTTDQPKENPFFTVSTKDDAASGSYDISVEQLASSTKIEQSFGKNDKFAPGKITITLPPLKDENGEYQQEDGKDKVRTIEIDFSKEKEGVTLETIRKKINDNDYGVTASIITVGDTKKLVIDSGISGEFESSDEYQPLEIKVEAAAGADSTQAANLEKLAYESASSTSWTTKKGQDAIIKIDGEEVKSNTNQFTNISGMTITANRVSEKGENGADKPTRLTVEQDDEAITKKVEEFVNAYNALQSAMSDLGKNNTFTNGKNNYDGGDLAGDSMLRSLSNQLQSLMTSFGTNNTEIDIYSIGLEVDKDGVFKLDSTKFKENISDNFNAVVKLFTNKDPDAKPEDPAKEDDGLLIKLDKIVKEYTKSKGVLATREEELNGIIKGYEEKEAKNAELLEAYEAGLRQKYAKLDNTIAGYNNSLSYLQSALI